MQGQRENIKKTHINIFNFFSQPSADLLQITFHLTDIES